MEIKGSRGEYYKVDLGNLTCTCKDWTCRRHNFSKENPKRKCKHIIEAIDINLKLRSNYTKYKGTPILVKESDISDLNHMLSESSIITRYSIGGTDYKIGSYLDKYIPIVIKTTYKISSNFIDKVFSNYSLETGNDEVRYYKGSLPIKVIISKNFMFQSLYYRMSKDDLVKISSDLVSSSGLYLTEYGIVDKENKYINMDISTEDELFDLLGVKV